MSNDIGTSASVNVEEGSSAAVYPASRPSGSYGRRNLTRQASMSMRSVSSLPLYSPREGDNQSMSPRKSHDRSVDSDLSSDEEEDEVNDLEMDTLNKNSQGRGGWKMLGSGEGHRSHPGSPTTPTSPQGRSAKSTQAGKAKSNNFEKFTVKEIVVMCIPLLFVTALTAVALHIVFVG